MALFNRDYDRDYGYRGTAGGYNAGASRGYDRDIGDRMRSGWNSMKRNTREAFGGGGGYDRDFNMGGRGGYDRDFTYRGTPGAQMGGGLSYDRDYNAGGMRGGYDRDHGKSRMQTEQGDPFNDRSRNTPIRVTQGEFHNYDRDFNAGGRGGYDREFNRGYDRDFNMGGRGGNQGYSAGVGSDPYENPNNMDRGGPRSGRQNMNRGFGRGYDNGMF